MKEKTKIEILFYFFRNYLFDKDGFIANIDLREKLSLPETTVRRNLNILEEKGIILKFKEGSKNVYQLNEQSQEVKELL